MNGAPNYLKLLRQNKQEDMPTGGTAQTAKSPLRSLCSSALAHKKVFFSGSEDIGSPASDNGRARVLAILAENPNIRRTVVVGNADTDPVLVTVAIRDLATFELAIPAAKFDAFEFLALVERHGGATVH